LRLLVGQSPVTCAVLAVSGSGFFLMCRFHQSQPKFGKGSPEFWVARVKPGRIMFEIDGVSWELAQEALRLAAAKLPLDTRIVRRLGDTE